MNLYSLLRSNFDLGAVSARSVYPEVTVHVCDQSHPGNACHLFFFPGIKIQGVVLLSESG